MRFDNLSKMFLINSGLDVSQVCAGSKFFAALTRGGNVYTWGHLGSEELGVTWPRHVPGVQAVQMSHGGGETIGVRGGTIVGGTRDERTEEEANKKQRSQKRKRNEDNLTRKKKCPAVHGRDHMDMCCKPRIQSKRCNKYI